MTVNTNMKLVVSSLFSSMKRLFDESFLHFVFCHRSCWLWSFSAFDVVQISLILSLLSASPQLSRPRLSSGNEGKLHHVTMNVVSVLELRGCAGVGFLSSSRFSKSCFYKGDAVSCGGIEL